MSGSSWAWLNAPSARIHSVLTSTVAVCIISSWLAEGNLKSFSDPLVLPPIPPDGDTSIPNISSCFTPSNSGFCATIGTSFSSPCLLLGVSLDTGVCPSDTAAGDFVIGDLQSLAPLPPSPSDSEPEAELLSDGE